MANKSNDVLVKGAQSGLDKMKFEIASELGVPLKQGYNGDISSKDNGRVGGEMVKRLLALAEKQL